MDWKNFVKDCELLPLCNSFKAFFKGGNNVAIEGRNSSLASVIA